MSLRVLSVTSEAVPLVKTGGLADVAGALPAALAAHDVTVTTLLPGYPEVLARLAAAGPPLARAPHARPVHAWPALLGVPARLLAGTLGAQPLLVLDAPALFARGGGIYGDAAGRDWPDNWRRFAALGRAAADIAGGAIAGTGFDLVHAHDWQAGLAPAYLRFAPLADAPPVASLMTIHNMAFQGWYPSAVFERLGLPRRAWSVDGVEYHGGVGFLKAGLATASAISTVSASYADEIRRAEFGMGLEGLITARAGDVHGILNGIDQAEWRPGHDPALKARFGSRSLARRAANTRALATEFGLDADVEGPLFIVVSRLTGQKGMDVLAQTLDHLVGIGGRLALLGSGDPAMEAAFIAAAARHRGRVAARIGYDEALSHRMQGGGDAILIPSRFEPCGLTQLYALAYGCVPVVARTGGLADTVIDANPAALAQGVATGVVFGGVSVAELAGAISRAVALYRQPEQWRRLQRNGMRADFSWGPSAKAYAALYARLSEDHR